MKNLGEWLKILIGVVAAILVGIWVGLNYDKKTILHTPSQIPPPPDTSVPMYFDFDEEEWKYLIRGHRAKEENCPPEPSLNEEELQRFLEKKIPGYLEDTYWGEEYDLKDPEDDEE